MRGYSFGLLRAEPTLDLVRESVDRRDDLACDRLLGLFHGRPLSNANSDLLALEQRFNESRPFMWAWILMLGSALMSMLRRALDLRRKGSAAAA